MMTVGFGEKHNPTKSPSSLKVTFSLRHEASSFLTDNPKAVKKYKKPLKLLRKKKNPKVVKKEKTEAALEKIITANRGPHQC